jgi:hypothetical protein
VGYPFSTPAKLYSGLSKSFSTPAMVYSGLSESFSTPAMVFASEPIILDRQPSWLFAVFSPFSDEFKFAHVVS